MPTKFTPTEIEQVGQLIDHRHINHHSKQSALAGARALNLPIAEALVSDDWAKYTKLVQHYATLRITG